MSDLLYYNPNIVTHERNHDLPGLRMFSRFFSIYNPTVVVIDRSNTLSVPVKVHSLFPLPKLRPFKKTFEEICDERAAELLERAERLGVPIYLFWSGGIDSTLVAVSLFKKATRVQREHITILLSEASIKENPNFYRDHIRGRLRTDSAMRFPYLIGRNVIIVNGEHNDQLFGSDIVAAFLRMFGTDMVHKPYNRNTLFAFFNERLRDPATTDFYLNLFEKLKANAPVPIETNYQVFWWINFSLKWQSVHFRALSYVSDRNAGVVNEMYLKDYYAPFYCTEDFQLWSMNNPDKKMKDEWRTYKWPCKDIIYDYTKDVDYRDNKIKRGSLFGLAVNQLTHNFIDDRMQMYHELDSSAYYNPKNDFV